MKRGLAGLALIIVAAALSGCYYDPGYSYVRPVHHGGDAYYGEASPSYYVAPAYAGGYYGDGYYSDGYYYGGAYYGCCYAPSVSIGIRRGGYRDSRYRHDHDRGHGYYRGDHRHGDDHDHSRHDHGHDRSRDHRRSSHHH